MSTRSPIALMYDHKSLGLTDQDVVKMYYYMVLARKYDERALLLNRAGKIPFHVSGIGQECAQVGAAFALRKETDYFLPYYRDYGFVLAVGMTVQDLMLQAFSRAADPNSGGRQLVGHFSSRKHHIVTGSSPVTTQVPHAVGIALAAKMKRHEMVSFVTFGEGSSNQGDFHEGCNFAGVHKLPVIFMCENNQYAISVPYHQQVASETVAQRATSYGFPGVRVDGNDVFEVYKAVTEARNRCIAGQGPTLIEAVMYRIQPHSASDNDLEYRSREEVNLHRQRDGIQNLRTYLLDGGLLDEGEEQRMLSDIATEIQAATEFAEQAPSPAGTDSLLHVYA